MAVTNSQAETQVGARLHGSKSWLACISIFVAASLVGAISLLPTVVQSPHDFTVAALKQFAAIAAIALLIHLLLRSLLVGQKIRLTTFFAAELLAFAAIAVGMADARTCLLALNTSKLIAATLVISLPLGTLLGILIARTDLPLRKTMAAILGLLVIVPLYLVAAAWQSGFGQFGWYTVSFGQAFSEPLLWKWRGAIFVHAVAAIPWVVLIVGLAARQVERQLEEAALIDGSGWQVFRQITLPRVWPAVGLAAIWIALLVATDMTVTNLFQVRTYAEEVYDDFAMPDATTSALSPWAGVMVVSALVAMAILLCAGSTSYSAKLLPKAPLRFALRSWRRPATVIALISILLIFGVPIASLIYKAGVVAQPTDHGVVRFWSAEKCLQITAESVLPNRMGRSIEWSLIIALGGSCITMLAAVPLAYLAHRGDWRALPALFIGAFALAIPAPLLGIGMIELFNNPALPFLNPLYQTIATPMLAQAFRALPLTLFIAWFAFRSVPEEQFEAAAIDGAGRWSGFWCIAVMQRKPALFGAWVAAFVLCMNELPATFLLEIPGRQTLPVAVYQLMHGTGEDRLAGIALLMLVGYALLELAIAGLWRYANAGRIE